MTAAAADSPPRRAFSAGAPAGFIEQLWCFLASPWCGPLALGAVAVLCLLGNVFNPDAQSADDLVAAHANDWWARLVPVLGLEDIYRSWWFLLLCLVGVLGALACARERLPGTLAAIRRSPTLSTERIAALPEHRRLASRATAERLAAILRAEGFQATVATGLTFGQRGASARLGPWVAQAALLLLLALAVAARLGEVDGVIDAPSEGGAFDLIFRHSSLGETVREPLGFEVKVEAFRVQRYSNGAVRSAETDLGFFTEGPSPQLLLRGTVGPGRSLAFRGWQITQQGFEPSPDRDQVSLHVLDKQSKHAEDLTLGKDAEAKFGPVTFKPINYTANLAKLGPALQIERSEAGKVTRFWVLQNYPDFDTDDRGDRFGLRFDGLSPSFVSVLEFRRQLSPLWWYLGGALILIALAFGLYGSHQRVWARIDGAEVWLGGEATRDPAAFKERFLRLAKAVEQEGAQ